MKKILITGKSSYIGTSFLTHLQNFSGYQVDAISVRGEEWKKTDFSSYDVVVHVAGLAHSDSGAISEERAKEYYRTNTELTELVAQEAKRQGVKQFIYLSSMSVFGASASIGKKKCINENAQPVPETAYGDSKLQAEKKIFPLDDMNFKVVIVRPPMVYGKGSKGNYPVLSKFSKKLPCFPLIQNERSMIYIENLCEFLRLMIDNQESGVFMPQNKEYVVTSELVKEIAGTAGKTIYLTKLFNIPLKLISPFVGVVNKVFGSLTYDLALSKYKDDYCLVGFEESVRRTEGL